MAVDIKAHRPPPVKPAWPDRQPHWGHKHALGSLKGRGVPRLASTRNTPCRQSRLVVGGTFRHSLWKLGNKACILKPGYGTRTPRDRMRKVVIMSANALPTEFAAMPR